MRCSVGYMVHVFCVDDVRQCEDVFQRRLIIFQMEDRKVARRTPIHEERLFHGGIAALIHQLTGFTSEKEFHTVSAVAG
jgi:hypothetical protein